MNRELRANIIKAKQETKKILPQEFSKNPFDILCKFHQKLFFIKWPFKDLKPDAPLENPKGISLFDWKFYENIWVI